MGKGANDNGGQSYYRKRTFDDGLTLWGAPALSHEIKLAGGPQAWAHRETAQATEAAVEAGIRAAIEVYDRHLREEGRLVDKVVSETPKLRIVR